MLAIIAGVFFAADDQTVVVTIIPSMMTDLNVGVTELNKVSWTITGYLLGYVAVMPVMGRLSDIFGRRNIYVIGMVIFMLGSIGTAMTGSMYWLIDSETLRNSNFGNSLGLIVRTTSTIKSGQARPLGWAESSSSWARSEPPPQPERDTRNMTYDEIVARIGPIEKNVRK